MRALPARIEALERRVESLEAPATAAPAGHLHTCAECGAPARVTAISPHPAFGALGLKERIVTCDNGHRHAYTWDPRKDA